jgi:hypothetical protein
MLTYADVCWYYLPSHNSAGLFQAHVCKYALTHMSFWFDRHVPYLASKINFVNEDMKAMMTSSRLKKDTYQAQSVGKYKTLDAFTKT